MLYVYPQGQRYYTEERRAFRKIAMENPNYNPERLVDSFVALYNTLEEEEDEDTGKTPRRWKKNIYT